MKFSEQLQLYMSELGVSSRELAREAGISESALSRYRSGDRTPSSDEEKLHTLAEALVRTATVEEVPYTAEEIYRTFYEILGSGLTVPYETYLSNLHQLMEIMGIRSNELARELSFDPSYISRILAGKRRPAEIRGFNAQVVAMVCKKAEERSREDTLSTLLGIPLEILKNPQHREEALLSWLGSNSEKVATHPVRRFLQEFDGFDLDEYMKSAHLDDVKRPVPPPVSLPKRKVYIGHSAIMEAELDFIRLTALNRSSDPVFFYSDFPLTVASKDEEFLEKWIFGMATLIRRGLCLRIIHDVHRPMSEMLLALENYLPLYMTGQIESHYLNRHQGELFSHLLWVSGGLALMGEAVSGYPTEGMHTLTNHAAELRYAKKRAKRLLERSNPLVQIYRDAERMQILLDHRDLFQQGDRRILCSYLPVAMLSDEEMDRYLERAGLDAAHRKNMIRQVDRRKKFMTSLLQNYRIRLDIPDVTEEEFRKKPVSLTFADVGRDICVEYSYEEYRAHLERVKEFAENYENLKLVMIPVNALRNVNIQLIHGQAVILTKNRAPLICFVMRQPNLVRTFEEFAVSLAGEEWGTAATED